jgi:hypothetical protein
MVKYGIWIRISVFPYSGEKVGSHKEDIGKGKQQNKSADSTPITRQGYRSGRLADDFWVALNLPHTPSTNRKTLRVCPIIVTNRKDNGMEYLRDMETNPPQPVAHVHIAELLAGIPWTETRVRQHIVSEVAQALYKAFVFTNPSLNPLQKWRHGKWFVSWEEEAEGDQICTLHVGIQVQENKLKPRKGQQHGWSISPDDLRDRLQAHNTDTIETLEDNLHIWHKTPSKQHTATTSTQEASIAHPNRFSILRERSTHTPSQLNEDK